MTSNITKQSASATRFCLMVALPCEAKPFIRALNLSKIPDPHYNLYQRDDIMLIQTGVSKLNAAMGVAYLCGKFSDITHFMNIGIAGSDAPVGSVISANKIMDQGTGENYYPDFSSTLKHRSQPCLSVDTVSTSYPENTLVDCEAAGFYRAANHFLEREYIRVIKIVSDNNPSQQRAISNDIVDALLEKNLEILLACVANLKACQPLCVPTYEWGALHLTTYQQHRYQALRQRYHVLFPERELDAASFATAKQLLHHLEHEIAHAAVEL